MTNQALTAPVRDAGARPIVAPLDKDAIKAQLARLEDPETLELQQRLAAAYDKACAALIGPNDEQEEKGRKFKKKSAWRKLGRHFGISTTIVREDLEQLEGGEFIARCLVRAFAPWGQQTDATGACGSDEESGRRTITMADAIATAQTRATNRAVSDLVAMGEVSAEEIGERAPKNGKARPSNRPELTLEEALELEFPWRNHAKYGGKKLAEVSTRLLLAVGKWAHEKIEAGDAGRAVETLHRATVLILETRDDLEAAIEAQRKEEDAAAAAGTQGEKGEATPAPAEPHGDTPDPNDQGATAGPGERLVDGEPVNADGVAVRDAAPDLRLVETEPGPAPAPEDPIEKEKELQRLSKRLVELLDDKRLTEEDRRKFLELGAQGKLATLQQLRHAIARVELILETTP